MNKTENASLNVEEYRRGAETLDSMPRVVYIETTNSCNLACPMCPITMGVAPYMSKSKLFSPELFDRLAPILDSCERCVMSGGGEPFMHPKFPDMIDAVKKRGAHIIFNTNATLMTENISKRLVDLQADTISFSIDAVDPQIYAKIRVGGRFSEVEKNIRALARLKKEARSDRPFLNIQMTLIKENADEIMPLIEKAAEWGVPNVVVEPLTPVFSTNETYAAFVKKNKVETRDILPAIRQAAKRAAELGVTFSSHYQVLGGDVTAPSPQNYRCPQPWINFGVRADGRVFPCCGADTIMGDINDSDPLAIWNGDEYRRFRKNFAAGAPPADCALCIREGRAMFFNADMVGKGAGD